MELLIHILVAGTGCIIDGYFKHVNKGFLFNMDIMLLQPPSCAGPYPHTRMKISVSTDISEIYRWIFLLEYRYIGN